MDNINKNQQNTVNTQKIQWVGNMAPGAAIAGRENVEVLESRDFSQYGYNDNSSR